MMIAKREKPHWSFYATWIILTSLCIPIAYSLSFVILGIIIKFVGDYIYVDGVRHISEDYLGLYVIVPVVGLTTGVLQYALLRRYLPRIGWWVLATTGGWLLGVLPITLASRLNWTNGSVNPVFLFVLMGFAIGVGQWLLVRRRLFRAGWWIGANVLSWGLLGVIMGARPLGLFGLFALGLLPACATAATLAYLINQVKPTRPIGV
jgi:hypothetical protein